MCRTELELQWEHKSPSNAAADTTNITRHIATEMAWVPGFMFFGEVW